MISKQGFTVVGVAVALFAAGSEVIGASFTLYRGACDASAVVLADQDRFVVADDEGNILRVYSRQHGGAPLQTLDLSPFLRVDPKEPEADLEGAAPLGDRVYWISSHARNKNGKYRPSRHRFFATTIVATKDSVAIKPVGFAYAGLLTDMLKEPRLRPFNLAAAAQREPKAKDALNIEGLCATPDGALLLGFRNPNPNGKALLLPLLNPAELTEGKTARFGDPLLLDLGGRGIRSIARSGNRYFIIAGSYNGEGHSSLYAWNGGNEVPQLLPQPGLTGLNPEAIEGLTENGVDRLFVVSDDGTRKIGSVDCKDVKDPNLKYFRGNTIDIKP